MANMISNQETTERNAGTQTGGNGGNQPQQGSQQPPGPAARAANLAAGAATKQVQKTRERVVDRVSEQRAQISGRVRSLSRALRGAGEMLEENDLAGNALQYASDKVETVAGYVAELSPDRVVEDLRGVARTHPLWFFGGAFVLGLAVGRFARSSGEGVVEAFEPEEPPSSGTTRARRSPAQTAGEPQP